MMWHENRNLFISNIKLNEDIEEDLIILRSFENEKRNKERERERKEDIEWDNK